MCEIEISQMGKNNGNPDLVCENTQMPTSYIVLLFIITNAFGDSSVWYEHFYLLL